ncbi:MAG: DUF1847 domain-containing protein [Anaerolineales bacterium]|nr:DUF1847 domain-containing protein [Anaerolineales bacterium]
MKKETHSIKAPSCAYCGIVACEYEPGTHRPPKFCISEEEPSLLAEIEKHYLDHDEIQKIAVAAAQTEASGYMQRTRIEDIMDFARRLGANRIGLAHCVGLIHEARLATEVFLANQFEVLSVCCKTGSIPKEKIGLRDDEKIRPGDFEPLCNPIAQAAILEKYGSQLNVLIGLCVGHDSLFFMHSHVPVTVLIAKDRVLGHNPAAALYTSSSYYKRLKPK